MENEWNWEVDYIKMKNLRVHKNNYFPAIGRLVFIETVRKRVSKQVFKLKSNLISIVACRVIPNVNIYCSGLQLLQYSCPDVPRYQVHINRMRIIDCGWCAI
jgi:hypothetical protein